MKKFKPISKEELEKLPEEFVTKVKNILKAYNECEIEFENGNYKIGSCCISNYYAPDHKFIGIAYQDDIYTTEERIQNYKEEFGCEPYFLIAQQNKEQKEVI